MTPEEYKKYAAELLNMLNNEDISIQLVHESNNQFDRNAVQVVATVKNKGSYCICSDLVSLCTAADMMFI